MGESLETWIEDAAELLPGQGPITVFIHHNTLHALEKVPFEEAVVHGGRLLGCEPYLFEDDYREMIGAGRIRLDDLEEAIRAGCDGATASVGGFAERAVLRSAWLRHGIPEASGIVLDWVLRETDVLTALRPDLPQAARSGVFGSSAAPEPVVVAALWNAAIDAVERAGDRPAAPAAGHPARHRDVLRLSGSDPDERVHPLLIRLCAAFLDQGIASWPMPNREEGFFRAVVSLYSRGLGPPGAFMGRVRERMREEASARRGPLESLERSLEELGVEGPACPEFLASSLLALRGWAGMMRQVERRPDRTPAEAPPARLVDFLAVRLLLDRAAIAESVREIGLPPSCEKLDALLAARPTEARPPSAADRAWPLFHLAQLLGRTAQEVASLEPAEASEVLAEIDSFDSVARRRVLHECCERRLRDRFHEAIAGHSAVLPVAPAFQSVFCIDEREESFRRHLEEIRPDCETFGTAGYFGVAMHYRGAHEAHGRPLAPVSIHPRHEVIEARDRPDSSVREGMRRAWGRVSLELAVGSRTVVRGMFGTVVLGAFASVPLILRVLFPRVASRFRRGGGSMVFESASTRLDLGENGGAAAGGRAKGFGLEEQAAIVAGLLEEIGCAKPAELVFVVGHGSTSLNNPHESAHDCGACGGGRGGPNARAFAKMANDPRVRRLLSRGGPAFDPETWFVGGEHNTASDAMDWFDLDLVPDERRPLLREALEAFEAVCRRNARERCRRFRAASFEFSDEQALAHVEGRSVDLAQTRPEYGHATNAFCVVGRRAITRGLFLDRRAFLASYDPFSDDASGTVLGRVLSSVVPVVAGISLEYYFAYVDPSGYGCDTKLPHNVSALLGVMDGHASDLRTGLPRQMTEIHEPVRLTLLVESDKEKLARVIRTIPAVDRLVSGRWIFASALDPRSGEIHELVDGGFVPFRRGRSGPVPSATTSRDWYRGRRGFLDFARLEPGLSAGRRS